MKTREEFETFLSNVDLEKYRALYSKIKIVEMDMPKNIQALDLIYECYWDNQEFLSFEDFYAKYALRYSVELKAFNTFTQMCETCFNKGLPARIYRTWASLITQIQAGYLVNDFLSEAIVEMNSNLDRSGIDFKVTYNNIEYLFQVKKDSQSRERRVPKSIKNDAQIITIKYSVPTRDIFDSPLKRNGEYKKAYQEFINNTALKRLDNGFVVFTKDIFHGTIIA